MKRVVGIILVLFATLLLGIEILAVIDPVGSQGANDNDPFGKPPEWYVNLIYFLVIAIMYTIAVVLIRKQSVRKQRAT